MSAFDLSCILAFVVYTNGAIYFLTHSHQKIAAWTAIGVPVITMLLLAIPGSELCLTVPPLADALRAIVPGLTRISAALFISLVAPLAMGAVAAIIVLLIAFSTRRTVRR